LAHQPERIKLIDIETLAVNLWPADVAAIIVEAHVNYITDKAPYFESFTFDLEAETCKMFQILTESGNSMISG